MPDRTAGLRIRPRTDDDRDACVQMASEVHARDGYPVYGADDLAGFLTLPDALGIWVAEHEGAIVGHVALRPTAQPRAIVESAGRFLSRPLDELCVLTRLLVDPSARRLGVGVALLDTAVADASARGLVPVLGVDEGTGAVAFYERCGWRRVEALRVRTPPGDQIVQVVYVGPG
jgi:GNAT superfamily N-acetyltransferase